MARIRHVRINRFRSIKSLEWFPTNGINCLIGHGDIGKTTLLTAIDYCLGGRRVLQLTDADFFNMEAEAGLTIEVTLGGLSDTLKSFEKYGLFLKGFDPQNAAILPEPEDGKETVLTVRLAADDSLDPRWTLVSDRAEQQGSERNLSWGDRIQLAPVRIGGYPAQHLSWQQGSILNRITEEKPDASTQLARAAREARVAFGEASADQLSETLAAVLDEAKDLGVPVGERVRALLDAHSVSFSGGTIALHDDVGLPLKSLGAGSSRLLVAGLQRRYADRSSITLVDEVELALEPHRIARLLVSLGSKDKSEPLQAFMTTHSPVTLKELSAEQLSLMQLGANGEHLIVPLGGDSNRQGTLRLAPEAFLCRRVLMCEGATEVGLIRGLDLFRSDQGKATITSLGTGAFDAGGINKLYVRANVFQELSYETATFRDDDVAPDQIEEQAFEALGGSVFKWPPGQSTEDAIFANVSDVTVEKLIRHAADVHGQNRVIDHLRSATNGPLDFEIYLNHISDDVRRIAGKAAKAGAWFKSITLMETAAREIIAPDLEHAQPPLRDLLNEVFCWGGTEDGA